MAGSHRGLALLAASLSLVLSCSFSITVAASTADDSETFTTSSRYASIDLMIDAWPAEPSIVLALPVVIEDREVTDYDRPLNRTHPLRERMSRNAVRPSSVAGWRSGRVKRLAAA